MDLKLYVASSCLGGALWNALFIALGLFAEDAISAAERYSAYVGAVGIVALALLVALALARRRGAGLARLQPATLVGWLRRKAGARGGG